MAAPLCYIHALSLPFYVNRSHPPSSNARTTLRRVHVRQKKTVETEAARFASRPIATTRITTTITNTSRNKRSVLTSKV